MERSLSPNQTTRRAMCPPNSRLALNLPWINTPFLSRRTAVSPHAMPHMPTCTCLAQPRGCFCLMPLSVMCMHHAEVHDQLVALLRGTPHGGAKEGRRAQAAAGCRRGAPGGATTPPPPAPR